MIKPSEISDILKKQLDEVDSKINFEEVGTVLEVGDGVAHVYGLTLECKLVSYDAESECMIGEIVNVSADEAILSADGTIDLTKFQPIAFDPANHTYLKLGEKVGNAFSDGAKLK